MSDRILIFENPGEIDPRLITTLGVNVKAGDNSPIGFFGTGLKYAIAVALREKCELRVQSGLREFRFEIVSDVIRGKSFDFIMMYERSEDGQVDRGMRLGFTTELGKTWKPWMAYRELRSNCLDETGLWRLSREWPEPLTGWTRFALRGEALVREHDRAGEFFLQTAPLVRCEGLDIHPRSGGEAARSLFYRGVRVGQFPHPSLYTYNIQDDMNLTEDRTVNMWEAKTRIARALVAKPLSEKLLREILFAEDGTFESTLDWSYIWGSPSELVVRLVEEARRDKGAQIPPSLMEWCKGKISRETLPQSALTRIETVMLARAKHFLARMGHEVCEKINIVESLGSQSTMGLAEGGEIFLPKALFGKGTKYLASTLLEEHLHCKYGFADGSRALQDWLFDRVVSLGEELQGEPL